MRKLFAFLLASLLIAVPCATKAVNISSDSGKIQYVGGVSLVSERMSQEIIFSAPEVSSPGEYSFKVSLKLQSKFVSRAEMIAQIRIITDSGSYNFSAEKVTVNNSGFTEISAKKAVVWNGKLRNALFVLKNTSALEVCDVAVKDLSIFKLGNAPSQDAPNISLPRSVGAVFHNYSVSAEPMLSNLTVRYRRFTPFCADLNNYRITQTSESFNEEIAFARYAGIDYFAYFIDENSYGHHLLLQNCPVKIAFILAKSSDCSLLKTHLNVLLSEKYFKIDGRCLIFLYGDRDIYDIIRQIRAVFSGNNDPIIALITENPVQINISGVDVIVPKGVCGDSYAETIKSEQNALSGAKGQAIAYVSSGKGTKEPADGDMFFYHMQYALKYTPALLIDSWNDCINGKCIVPTLAVGSSGDFLQSSGRYSLNTALISAVHIVSESKYDTVKTEYGSMQTSTPDAVPGTAKDPSHSAETEITSVTEPDATTSVAPDGSVTEYVTAKPQEVRIIDATEEKMPPFWQAVIIVIATAALCAAEPFLKTLYLKFVHKDDD